MSIDEPTDVNEAIERLLLAIDAEPSEVERLRLRARLRAYSAYVKRHEAKDVVAVQKEATASHPQVSDDDLSIEKTPR